MANIISIQKEKCIGCGLCVKDCPSYHISLENGRASARSGGCLECGHCFAICPVNAVSMAGYDCKDEPAVSMTEFDSGRLLAAMKSRRSIRSFSPKPVEEEKLAMILEAGRWSPTAANAQDVVFTVLGSRRKEAEEICTALFRSGKKLGSALVNYLRGIEITDDFFFKGAPLVILVSGKSAVNPGLASSYMELMAESLGLGVLYSGFFVACTRLSPKLRRLLELPLGHKVLTCMVIGYGDVEYRRIPPRRALKAKRL